MELSRNSERRGGSMINFSKQAIAVMRQVTAHPKLSPSSGLRIAVSPGRDALQVRAVRAPEPGDRVVEEQGGRLYLGPRAAGRVDGHVLDAVTDPEGRVHVIMKTAA
jgi:Fe-S cluster assembly iron-binding protein IscA